MLKQQLPRVLAGIRQAAGEQFLEDDGEAVLIAVPAQASQKQLGSGVKRRDGVRARSFAVAGAGQAC